MPDIFKQKGISKPVERVNIPDMPVVHEQSEPEEEPIAGGELNIEPALEQDDKSKLPEPEPEKFTPAIMTSQEIAAHYAKELKVLAADAVSKAYFDAIHQRKGELNECMKRVDDTLQQLEQMQYKYMQEYSRQLKYLAIDIAEKMIAQKIEEDELVLAPLVMQTVSGIKNSDWINVELSEKLVGLIDFVKQELSHPDFKGKALTVAVPGTSDLIRIGTEDGTIVATISAQAENLRQMFEIED